MALWLSAMLEKKRSFNSQSDQEAMRRLRFPSPLFAGFSPNHFSLVCTHPQMNSNNSELIIHCDGLVIRAKSLLGEGCFGKVYSAKIDGDRERYALKIVPTHDQFGLRTATIELKILKLLFQQNAHKHSIVKTEMLFIQRIQGRQCACILMERMSLSICEFQRTRANRPFTLKEIKKMARQILKAVKFIHKMGIVHSDIKPTNILCSLLTDDLQVKLTDFGNAETLDVIRGRKENQPLGFRAPEVLLGLPFNERIDIFSVGVVLAELYSGKQIFPADNIYQLTKFQFDLLGLPNGAYAGTRFHDLYEPNHKTGKYEPRLPESLILDGIYDDRRYQMKTIRDIAKYGAVKNTRSQTILFIVLLEDLLNVNGFQRATAKEALASNFFFGC